MKADDHTIQTRTKMVIGKDKIIAGETTETTTGTFSLKARKFAASLRDTGPKKAAADRLEELETPGTGNFEAAVDGFINPIVVSGQFTLAARLKTEPSESWTPPVGLTVQDDPFEYFFGKRHEKRRFAFTCHAGRIQEEVEVSFAEGIPLPKPAKARTVNTPIFSYKSAYALENRTLKIRREFASYVQSQACPAELEAFITQPLKAVQDDLETEFVFTGSRTSRSSNEKRKTKQPVSVLQRSLPGRG